LCQKQAGLDRLSETDLVGEDRALGERALEREERGLDLVRVQVHLRIGEHRGELLDAVGGAAARQLVGKIPRMVIG